MTPSHSPLPPSTKRLRWKSRRGWLELDLLLSVFWQRHGNTLTAAEATLLAQWLELDDEQLWALLHAPPAGGETLAKKIRADDTHTGANVYLNRKTHS